MNLSTDTNTKPKDARDLPAPVNDHELRARLLRSPRGLVVKCNENLELVLRHSQELRGNLRFNELTLRVEVTGERFRQESQKVPELLHVGITNWLEAHWDLKPTVSELRRQMLAIAREHSYSPPGEYLRPLQWDGKPRLDNWLSAYCSADDTLYNRKVGARFMLSAVARALTPGCEVNSLLILKGPQGCGKSTVVSVLGDPWSSSMLLGFDNKESRLGATRAWIVEVTGLTHLLESRHSARNAFLRESTDEIRPMYANALETVPRQCVFVCTTNDDPEPEDFERPEHFWVVGVGKCDTQALKRDRDQLWAEAVVRFHAGEHWGLLPDEPTTDD